MQADFFTTIVELAHERPLTAADFVQFIGRENWLSFEKAEPLGNCDAYPDAAMLSGVVYKFRLLGAYPVPCKVPYGYKTYGLKPGMVMVALTMPNDDPDNETYMAMDADELAIRMDES